MSCAKALSFWLHFGFWVGVGYVAFGALMALVMMLNGYRIADSQTAIKALNLPAPIVLNSKSKSYVIIKRDSQHALSLDDGSHVYVAEISNVPKK